MAEPLTSSGPIEAPTIPVPSGGGAIKGLGENFSPNSFSGTAGYGIPITVTPARGFEPDLTLQYNSGNGNGPFGQGFSLPLSKISIRTERGIPKYDGRDVFLFDDEELVLSRITPLTTAPGYEVREYVPRVQSAFDLIHHFVRLDGESSYWVVTNNANETSCYGRSEASRIYDPGNPARIFAWLIDSGNDAKGNQVLYRYKAEDTENVPDVPWEKGRSFNNKYIQSLQYGNYKDSATGDDRYAFELIFDYGEYDLDHLTQPGSDPYQQVRPWAYRPDAFSVYSSGFEIRTCRLCRHILLFHHFPNEIGDTGLVKSLRFSYCHQGSYQQVDFTGLSLPERLMWAGYRRNGNKATDPYQVQEMPPLAFRFTPFSPPADISFDRLTVDGGDLPGYLDSRGFQPLDLYGEGLPGLLFSEDRYLAYYESAGNGNFKLPDFPSGFPIDQDLGGGEASLVDLNGDGALELVVKSAEKQGFYAMSPAKTWRGFEPFKSYPTEADHPAVETAGLSNTGKADLLLVENDHIRVYPSLGTEGFAEAVSAPKTPDFPSPKAGYAEEYVGFVDLLGDGLAHRVRVRNGSVECWPDLGYGAFGPKITLGNAPDFGRRLNSARLFFADVDGSGTMDLLYAFEDHVQLFVNHCGNYFSDPIIIPLPEAYNELDQIRFMDIYGNGTTCLVFSKMTGRPAHYYFDFIGCVEVDTERARRMKPYLLFEIDNNMGALTRISYGSSVRTCLEDKAAGNPWPTRLPFPVQVMDKVIRTDRLSGARFTTRFKFHDGFYDPVERRFQGFGFVESWDTESYPDFVKNSGDGASLAEKNYAPPVYTKTWHNTGALFYHPEILDYYRSQYFQGDATAYAFPGPVMGGSILEQDAETIRQAYTALQGHIIRTEVYALDADTNPDLYRFPYAVSESNLEVRITQTKGDQPFAVFLVVPRESISYRYERNPDDPRVEQEFTLRVDGFGNPLASCSVFLPRRPQPGAVFPEGQTQLSAILTLTRYVKPLTEYLYFQVACETQQLEIIGLRADPSGYCRLDEVRKQLGELAGTGPAPVAADSADHTPVVLTNLLSWRKTCFWNEQQSAPLANRLIASKGLTHHQEEAVFSKAMTVDIFDGRLIDEAAYASNGYCSNVLYTLGGYAYDEVSGYWWNKGLTQRYYDSSAPQMFYLPSVTENSFANDPLQPCTNPQDESLLATTVIGYDDYALLPVSLTQVLDDQTGNTTRACYDYYACRPRQIVDINGNTTQFLFDPLGQVVVTSLFGSENGVNIGGMTLYPDGPTPAEYTLPADITLESILADKDNRFLQGASSFFYYNLNAWSCHRQPCSALTLTRNNYFHGPDPDQPPVFKTLLAYYDGLGRTIEQKLSVDPGMAYSRDAAGILELGSDNCPLLKYADDRWQVTGRTVYNNKGNPFEQYLPYFINTPNYEDQKDITCPKPTILSYDALDRVVRTDTPKGFFTKVEFTPWMETSFDENDTVLDSPYYRAYNGKVPPNEQDALDKAARFYNTPGIKVLDNKGVTCLDIVNNLGNVAPGAFDPVGKPPGMTSQDIWNALLGQAYLIQDAAYPALYWVTEKFQPYQGVALALPPPFEPILPEINRILLQNCLTSFYKTDLLGRTTESIDPRLYFANISENQHYFNFKYQYPLNHPDPVLVDSADAGIQKHLSNIYGQLLWSWSARDYCQLIRYDRLQRKTRVNVKKITTPGVVEDYRDFNVVEWVAYGENIQGKTGYNLRGQVYETDDLSGILRQESYSMLGAVLQASRQMVADYRSAANWNPAAPAPLLEPGCYESRFTYNALGQLIDETTPDASVTTNTYNRAGQLESVSVKFADGTGQAVINRIDYDANGQRAAIQYGNQVSTAYTYEPTTLRLTGLKSTRPAPANGGPTVQDITYFYDPVGNITRALDNSVKTVFSNNKKIDPLQSYRYDPLYRLVQATGRQHQGIAADTYKNNWSEGFFKQCIYGPTPSLNDPDKLENYTIFYTYDESGNLIKKDHRADITPAWSRGMAVNPDSNRLQNSKYDGSGNMRTLNINGTVDLVFNCCENLVKAGIIQRPGVLLDDCDYYLYDGQEQRTRKTSERLSHGTVNVVEDRIYLGNYEIKRKKSGSAPETTFERQTLRVMDGDSCVAIIHYIAIDKSHPANIKDRQCRFQMDNNLGSVSVELDPQGLLITYEEYFPYGGTAIITGTSQREVKLKTYRYSGKERDDSTGLYYYGARYYLPWLGRWLSSDPAGPADGMNLYAFVAGNPLRYTDPDGRMKRPRRGQEESPEGDLAGEDWPFHSLQESVDRGTHSGNDPIKGDRIIVEEQYQNFIEEPVTGPALKFYEGLFNEAAGSFKGTFAKKLKGEVFAVIDSTKGVFTGREVHTQKLPEMLTGDDPSHSIPLSGVANQELVNQRKFLFAENVYANQGGARVIEELGRDQARAGKKVALVTHWGEDQGKRPSSVTRMLLRKEKKGINVVFAFRHNNLAKAGITKPGKMKRSTPDQRKAVRQARQTKPKKKK